MIIAIFLDNIYSRKMIEGLLYAFLFRVENDQIKAIGEELIKIQNINYICLWLTTKKVQEIYCDRFTDTDQKLIRRMGIKIKNTEDIIHNPILQAMLVKHTD